VRRPSSSAVANNLREYKQLYRNASFTEISPTSLWPTPQQALAAKN
jgi:hypothetical protein